MPPGAPAVKSNEARIAMLRLVTPARGQHYLLVKVSSGSGSAKLRIRPVELVELVASSARAGHEARITRTRTVAIKTNRVVRIAVTRPVLKVPGVSLVG
ncbi:MAG: hypothetical protein WCD11_34775 [Solirubrobacteraceae bacterium]